ncbi:hypothetical protein [Asticcacaulis endophyticus]|uniref:Uncharacterized protein n=1 Tax=Asticcacaulis endophyticus TaxID=1395890 RepID=A0A918PSZ4_9CAUL|nr:hypothetical protein [Asticcacaulis endophyticus]GGZ21862.1 hypothetical protein GCM10011273_03310 [Asticcacaulis endophyticus]
MASTDKYTRIEQAEYLRLDCPGRPGKLPLAMIRLGQHNGLWAAAIEFHQMMGDCWGMGEPLGIYNGNTSRLFRTRSEAVNDAAARMLEKIYGRPVLMAAQIAWAKSLQSKPGDQMTLFGEVA